MIAQEGPELIAENTRHLFAPEASLEAAYNAWDIVRTKYNELGATDGKVFGPE